MTVFGGGIRVFGCGKGGCLRDERVLSREENRRGRKTLEREPKKERVAGS